MDPNVQQSQQPIVPQSTKTQVPPQMQRSSSLPKRLLSVLGALIVLGLIGGAYYLGVKNNEQQITKTATQSMLSPTGLPTISPTQYTTQYENWLTYTNKTYNYSFMYPSSWVLDISKAEPATTDSKSTTSASLIKV